MRNWKLHAVRARSWFNSEIETSGTPWLWSTFKKIFLHKGASVFVKGFKKWATLPFFEILYVIYYAVVSVRALCLYFWLTYFQFFFCISHFQFLFAVSLYFVALRICCVSSLPPPASFCLLLLILFVIVINVFFKFWIVLSNPEAYFS